MHRNTLMLLDFSFAIAVVCLTDSAYATPVEAGSATTSGSFVADVAEALVNSTVVQLSQILANASVAKSSTIPSSTKPTPPQSSKSHSNANEWVQNKSGKWEWKGKSTTIPPATPKFLPQIRMVNVTNSTGQVIGSSPQLVLQSGNQSVIPHFQLSNVTNSTGDVVGVGVGVVLDPLNITSTSTTPTTTVTSTITTTKAGTTGTTLMSSVPSNTFSSNSSVSASVFNSATDLAGARLKVGERLVVSAVLPESNTVVLRVKNDNATSSNTSADTSFPMSSATTRWRPVSTSTTHARDMDFLDNSSDKDFEALSRDDGGERSPTKTSFTGSPGDGLSFALTSALFRQAVADAVQKEMEKFRASEAKRLEDKRNEISKPTSQKEANLNDGAGVITLVEQSRVGPAQTTEAPSTTSTTTTTPTTTTTDERVVVPPNLSEKQKLILKAQEEKTRKSEQASSSSNSGPAKIPAVTFSSDDISNGLGSFFQGVVGLFGGGGSDSTPSVSSIFSALPFTFSGADTLRNAQVAAANFKPSKSLQATFS